MAKTRQYNSFSGADVTALFNNIVFAEIQHIQFNVSREKIRLWTLGSADPRSVSRGKRSIGGVMVFAMVDSNALYNAFKASSGTGDNAGKFYTKAGEVRTDSNPRQLNEFTAQTINAGQYRTYGQGGTYNLPGSLYLQPEESDLTIPSSGSTIFSQLTDPWYSDQIPAFMVSLVASNEYGSISTAKLFGVELIEEGSGVGIDDIVIEEQYGFIALGYQRWTRIQNAQIGGFGDIPATGSQ